MRKDENFHTKEEFSEQADSCVFIDERPAGAFHDTFFIL